MAAQVRAAKLPMSSTQSSSPSKALTMLTLGLGGCQQSEIWIGSYRWTQMKTGGLNLATQAAGRVFDQTLIRDSAGKLAACPTNYFTASEQPRQASLHDGAGQQTVTGTCLQTQRGTQRVTV